MRNKEEVMGERIEKTKEGEGKASPQYKTDLDKQKNQVRTSTTQLCSASIEILNEQLIVTLTL